MQKISYAVSEFLMIYKEEKSCSWRDMEKKTGVDSRTLRHVASMDRLPTIPVLKKLRKSLGFDLYAC